MPAGRQPITTIEVESFGGENTALPLSQVPRHQSPKMINAYQTKIGALGKRPGTIPAVSGGTWPAAIEYMSVYYTPTGYNLILRMGTTLYKYDGVNTVTAQTMTNAFTANKRMTAVAFTDQSSNSILFIADGGALKSYNGTAVANIAPAANDADPAPKNNMAAVNAKGPLYAWVFSSYLFVSDGSDTAYFSKRYIYNYFPEVHYHRWVRENDRMVGPGLSFNNVCLIPMRRGWGILTGVDFDSFQGNQFLNTISGVAAGRTVQRLTYPDGTQTIAYVSDDGVYEVYDTGFQDTGSRQYSTRSITVDKLNWEGYGLAQADLDAMSGYYDARLNLYILSTVQKPGTPEERKITLAYDVRNREWYEWTGLYLASVTRMDGLLYFGSSTGPLTKFDAALYSDWNDTAKTSGTPVDFDRYGPLLTAEYTGFPSAWDEYLLEAREFAIPATLDISVAFGEVKDTLPNTITASAFIWGISQWGAAHYATGQYTEVLFEPTPLIFHRLAKYAQVRWRNNRDEPVEIYREKWKVRVSGG